MRRHFGRLVLDLSSLAIIAIWTVSIVFYGYHRGSGRQIKYLYELDAVPHLRAALDASLILLVPTALSLTWLCWRITQAESRKRDLVYVLMQIGLGEQLMKAGYGDWLEEMGYRPEENWWRGVLRFGLGLIFSILIFVLIRTLVAST